MPIIALHGRPDEGEGPFLTPDAARAVPGAVAVELPNDADARALGELLERARAIRIAFPGFADGRGFSLARRLRDLGYRGRLRAAGWLLPDQQGHACACGFDEIEIDAAALARHGPEAWARRPAEPPYRRRRSGEPVRAAMA